jgi:hypothetical protein
MGLSARFDRCGSFEPNEASNPNHHKKHPEKGRKAMADIKKSQNERTGELGAPKEGRIMAEPEVLKGTYCNMANVYHSKYEFVIDCINRFPREAHLVSRIVTNPPHAKALLKALQDNVEKYEEQHGIIPEFGESIPNGLKH